MSGLAVLARVRAERAAGPAPRRCDLCAAPVGDAHAHVVDVERRSLHCTCRACWLLFDVEGARQALRAVPERVVALPPEAAAAAGELGLPVGTAFLLPTSHAGLVALYPGPAGATEGAPDAEAWAALVTGVPVLQTLRPDVEAVLVHRGEGPAEAFLVPVDRCYALTGLLRTSWRGFDGGPEARAGLEAFLADLRRRAVRR